ncbi:MAG: DUF2971 domain-containing protein [Bacteroidaceae bacterium]|nr:DUF2971 domain-containing protein [Bacteroidaceae bacterium]
MLLTKLPAYLYWHEELPHKGDGALFHYTNLESFKKILEDLTLLPSSFERLNDMNEGNVHYMNLSQNFMVMYNTDKYIKEKCRIICFSQNYDIKGFGQEGTNHPAMWAHYADNSNGVCIVIDKEAFISKNKDIFENHFYKFEDVEYNFFNTPDDEKIDFEAETKQEFIKKNWKSLFFLKHKDWENEDEHRLFIMGYDGKLSIDGCIKYIVLGRKLFLDNIRIKDLLDIIVNPSSICYHKFTPHSFATMCYNSHGYDTMDIASKILSVVMSNISDPPYLDYVEWLNTEQGYDIS